jgi:dihydrofolate synthase/folylpolyglutamate synthase
MNLSETMQYIHSVSWLGTIPGLERERELLSRLGNPEKALKFVHIAGTNGKGSTAAMLAAILRRAGYRTGLYTSPYLYRFQERMQINGKPIPDADLIADEVRKYFSDSNIRTLCVNSMKAEKERLSWKSFSKKLIDFSDNLYKLQ